jgi:hypothetical protein
MVFRAFEVMLHLGSTDLRADNVGDTIAHSTINTLRLQERTNTHFEPCSTERRHNRLAPGLEPQKPHFMEPSERIHHCAKLL